MPLDNSIPNKIWQMPSAADSYLEGRQAQDAHEAASRNAMIQDRQVKAMDRAEAEDAVKQLAPMIDALQPGDAAGFANLQKSAAALRIDPSIIGKYTANDIPMLKAKAGEFLAASKQQAFTNDMATKHFGLSREQFVEQKRHNMAVEARAAEAARVAKTAGRVDPNSGVRIPPAGVQGKDVTQLQKYEQTADAFSGIAQVLRNAEGAFGRITTGPGTGIARMAAAPFAAFGVESANKFVSDFDAIDAAAKEGGIEKLKGIGGSDTERELLTAIQTGVGVETPTPENKRRVANAIAAAEIAASRHRLATEWVNKFGALSYAAGNGMTWPQFWRTYQKTAWADHLKTTQPGGGADYRADQRGLLNGTSKQGGAAPPPGFEIVP